MTRGCPPSMDQPSTVKAIYGGLSESSECFTPGVLFWDRTDLPLANFGPTMPVRVPRAMEVDCVLMVTCDH